jgi:hypothetical protein
MRISLRRFVFITALLRSFITSRRIVYVVGIVFMGNLRKKCFHPLIRRKFPNDKKFCGKRKKIHNSDVGNIVGIVSDDFMGVTKHPITYLEIPVYFLIRKPHSPFLS